MAALRMGVRFMGWLQACDWDSIAAIWHDVVRGQMVFFPGFGKMLWRKLGEQRKESKNGVHLGSLLTCMIFVQGEIHQLLSLGGNS